MRWPDLPPLNTLLPFEAAVRHASMTNAAHELHVTHGAVSRQIQNLERAMGMTLFERGTRTLRPTPEARQLAAAVRDALDQIDTAARLISRRPVTGPLTLSCEPTLLMRWLIPRLPDLKAQAPDLDLHLSAGGGPLHLERDNIDLAIRRDDFPFPPEMTRTYLFAERIGPVCRFDLVPGVTTADGIAADVLLHTATRRRAWDDWRSATGMAALSGSEQTFEHFYLTLKAASAGIGTAIGPYALVHDDLVQGQLAAPHGFVPDGTGYYLLSRRPPEDDARISVLLSWLRTQAAQLGDGNP
ncbi:LysR family transcriptional regulator [Streptomyces stelliscabiei]|uniref:LysR family transcriptional regulator n=1 Tax=Streptomyces stelliscabiei TaxID=146820 RepID=UPI002FEE7601